ncbi:MAG: ABC transporter permease [Bryobacterales bacterium]
MNNAGSARPPQQRGFLRDAFGFALSALWAHKTRSALTGLSMVIANASVIVVVSVALAGRDFVVQLIEGVGANLIYAYYEAGGNVSTSEADYITLADLEAVKTQLGDVVTGAAAVMSTWDTIPIDGRSSQVRVLGSNEDYRVVRNLTLPAGRFFDERDIEERRKVGLLTEPLAAKLFGSSQDAVGEEVKVHGLRFTVIGVFREGVDTFGQSEVAADSVLIPISVMKYFQNVERVDPLYVSVRSQEEVDEATVRVRQLLESRHRPGSTYRVENLAGILRAAREISTVLTIVLLIIAAITLAISGIFIMNIMLISVNERTKEIGIRMAVGATRRKVQYQFLLEAVCISLLGGLVGVMLGVFVPLVARQFLPQLSIPISPMSIVAAVVVSATVGAVFGLLPASRAAKLDPVEALRYE